MPQLTEYERSLYFTEDGRRKTLPFKERFPCMLFYVAAFLDAFLLYGILYLIAFPGSSPMGAFAGIFQYCIFYAVFLVLFRGKRKWLKDTTLAATYENSHDPNSWKPIYKRNLKIAAVCAVMFFPLLGIFCLMTVIF